ncbi:MAG: GntR family transcriptional regulator [Pyramidobacter sp.]|nr:GntR family transcriptional regulator [Pyramidobacter sp.]
MYNPLHPAKNMDLRQIVYEKIKQAIVEGIIKPGEKLSEVELAEKMAVSRTPVREAIRQLAKTSLVTLVPRKGAYVSLPSVSDASALYELREDLEMFAVSLVSANPPVSELNEFRAVFAGMDKNTEPQYYLEEDRRFHLFLYQTAGNRFLMNSLLELVDVINLYRPYSLGDRDYIKGLSDGHVAIIDALLARDEKKARAEMGAHIRMSRTHLETYLGEHMPDRLGMRS